MCSWRGVAVVLYSFDLYSWKLTFSLLGGGGLDDDREGNVDQGASLSALPPAVDVATLMKPALDLEFRV